MSNNTQLSLIKISGDDAASFLQGQLTNDVTELTGSSKWQYAGYCSPKGRLLALFILWQEGNEFFALLDQSILEPTVNRLRMFVMRSKVAIEPDNAIELSFGAATHQELGRVTTSDEVAELGFGTHTLLIKRGLPEAQSQSFDAQRWDTLQIAAGLPSITHAIVDIFVPQMVNLDLVNGINFKKGCYTGQEIVARMHYLGKLKQRMFVCHADNINEVAGSKITTSDGRSVGNIVSIGADGACLAVLRLELAREALKLESGTLLQIAEQQPYSIPGWND